MRRRIELSQIQHNLLALISGTGISQGIITNPAFKSFIDEISKDIGEIGAPNIVDYHADAVSFGFTVECKNKERAFLEVAALSKNQLSCAFGCIKRRDYDSASGKIWEKKEYTQYHFTSKDGLSVDKKIISFDNRNTDSEALEIVMENIVFEFDKKGILVARKYIQTDRVMEIIDINRIDSKSLLQITERSMPGLLNAVNYEEIIKRKYIDVANLSIIDKQNHRKFQGTVPLENVTSLQDMIVSKKTVDSHNDIKIFPLSQEDLLFLLVDQQPAFRDGLKRYCNGRESFCYLSSNDPNFVNEKNPYPDFKF